MKHLTLLTSLTNQSAVELQRTAEMGSAEIIKKAHESATKLPQDQHTGITLDHQVSNYLFQLDDGSSDSQEPKVSQFNSKKRKRTD